MKLYKNITKIIKISLQISYNGFFKSNFQTLNFSLHILIPYKKIHQKIKKNGQKYE